MNERDKQDESDRFTLSLSSLYLHFGGELLKGESLG